MKSISIFAGKFQKFRAVWEDGYITNIVWDNDHYRLEGNKRSFKTLSELMEHYKGTIKTMREIKK